MKRAEPQDQQHSQSARAPRPTNPTSRPHTPNAADLGSAVRKLANWLVRILTFPIQVFTFLTNPPGSAIILGIGVVYFALLNIEGYWQSLPSVSGIKTSFLPKPFIDDAADLRNLSFAVMDGGFYIAGAVSLIIQSVQALMLREVSAAKAKADYEAVAQFTVPEANPRAIDLAELRRQKYKRVGIRTARQKGIVILLVYGIDVSIALWNYPLAGLPSAGALAINAVWVVLSVLGCELAINMFLDALEHAKEHRLPKSEVV